MEINSKVGEAAGQVWQVLSNEGPLTVTQLKNKLNGTSDVMSFALGWLARENKIEISQEKKTFRVRLR